MFNICVEMPSGMKSRGYNRKTDAEAQKVFLSVVSQIRSWKDFVASVVMVNELEEEVQREAISAER